MGFRNYDRWSAEEWRRTAETVGQMRKAGWEVLSYCRACHLTMRVDLDVIVALRGPDTVLWNRQARCRRIGCGGVVDFLPAVGRTGRRRLEPLNLDGDIRPRAGQDLDGGLVQRRRRLDGDELSAHVVLRWFSASLIASLTTKLHSGW